MTVTGLLSRACPGWLRAARTTSILAAIAAVVGFGTVGFNLGSHYYWLMFTALLPAALYVVFRRALILARARVSARERWLANGSEVERIRHGSFKAMRDSYAAHTRDEAAGWVDDRTWTDLGMDGLLERVDVSCTVSGSNELHRILRHALPPIRAVEERAQRSERFTSEQAYREAIAGVLAGIGEERDADPAQLLWGDGAQRNRLFPLFVSMSLLAVMSIVITAAFSLSTGLVMIVVTFLINMWIYYRKARHISVFIPALRILSRMISAAGRLPGLQEVQRTAAGARGAFRLLLTGAPSPVPSLGGDIIEMLFLYVKIYFQVDLLAYERIVSHIVTNRDDYRALYHAVGSLDAAFALASYRAARRQSCTALPDGTTAPGDMASTPRATGPDAEDPSRSSARPRTLAVVDIYHPLIEDAVANTVTLTVPGAIVTGTNMAGKSTFLRTIGISVLFAQTAGFAFAREYRAPRFRVISSIEKHDDLAEGKSFYYDEAERIYRMIEEVRTDVPALLLIDELLAGTNSLERESASIAILHYLADRNALTIAATHDVTIAGGVQDRYSLYYFTDGADENGLTFDYRIQEGVVRTRNAIKLLRLIGYPEDVIRVAMQLTDEGE